MHERVRKSVIAVCERTLDSRHILWPRKKKTRKLSGLEFDMTLYLQQLQGIQRSKLKRYHFSIKGIRNGYLFCQNGTEALYRGDRCSEVEIRVSVWTVRQKNGRCRKVAAVEGWSFMEVRLYLKGERLDAGQGSPRIKFC